MILKEIIDINEYASVAETRIGVFGSKDWLSVYGKALTVMGIYKNENQLIGGFYYLKSKKLGLSFLKLPPYTPHCGLFFIGENKNRSAVNGFSKEVIGAVCDHFMKEKAALTIIAFPTEIVDLQPFIWSKFKVVPNYTYQVDLSRTISEIKADFDPKNRNAINKAISEKIEVTENSLAPLELFDYFNNSLNTAGANVYGKELKNIFLNFSKKENSFAMVAKHNGKVAGVVFCIFDNKTCYYLLGGVDKSAGVQGINNLLVLKSIEKAQSLGCTVFDFEGSMLKGVEKFFRSFGPKLLPYYTVNKASLPIEMVLKFKKRELF